MLSPKISIPLILSLSATSLAQSLDSILGRTSDLSSLATILGDQAALLSTLVSGRNITILAPSNNAFGTFLNSSIATIDNSTLEALLGYHILEGAYRSSDFVDIPHFLPTMLRDRKYANFTLGGKQVVEAVRVDNKPTLYSGLHLKSTVTTGDVTFDGGVIHVIDTVLTLPMNVSTTAIAANLTAAAGALRQANLVDAVDSMQSVTIFAPTNAAFQAIGNLLPDLDSEDLTSILTYHVVPNVVGFSSDLSDGQKLTTLEGGELTITIEDDKVFVNGAQVILADVITSNGVVHVINSVLNPDNTDDEPNVSDPTQSPAFPSATSVSDVPFTSGIPTPTTTDSTTGTPSGSPTPTETSAANTLRGNIAAGAVMGAVLALALAVGA